MAGVSIIERPLLKASFEHKKEIIEFIPEISPLKRYYFLKWDEL